MGLVVTQIFIMIATLMQNSISIGSVVCDWDPDQVCNWKYVEPTFTFKWLVTKTNAYYIVYYYGF